MLDSIIILLFGSILMRHIEKRGGKFWVLKNNSSLICPRGVKK